MKEQLLNELKELATSILENRTVSTEELKIKSQQLYEQVILLAYAEKNEVEAVVQNNELIENSILELASKKPVEEVSEALGTLGNINFDTITKEDAIEEFPTFDIDSGVVDMAFDPAEVDEVKIKIDSTDIPKTTFNTEEVITEVAPTKDAPREAPALLHELEDLTKDFNLPEFESATNSDNTLIKQKTSLNDSLNTGFQLGLNDRLAFVNNLFNGSNEDLTRVISQLNTKENLTEAQTFVHQIVKPEYNNWEGKEAFEVRFLELVERNFNS